MKKIILLDRVRQGIDQELFEVLSEQGLFTAYSNEDALRVHRKEKASLIITELYGSGMSASRFCDQVRDDAGLRDVSIVVCFRDNEIERREAEQCRANAVLPLPLSSAVFGRTVEKLLHIPARGAFRAEFSARPAGSARPAVGCRVENISATGMLIAADGELRRGDRLHYSLDLEPSRSFALQAEVVRSDRGRYGVRFSRIDPAARRAIESLVNAQGSVC